MSSSENTSLALIAHRARALNVGPFRELFTELAAKALQLLGTHGQLSPTDRQAIELYFDARRQVAGAVEGVVTNNLGVRAANYEKFHPTAANDENISQGHGTHGIKIAA